MSDNENIKVLEEGENFLAAGISSIPKSTKPGWQSTEFWMTIGYALLTFTIASFKPELLENWEAFVGGAIAITGYSVSRGQAKN